MVPEQIYAHSKKDTSVSKWQTLEDHLNNVGELAAVFAEPFESAEWGRILGALHDVGKSRVSFQNYLRFSNGLLDSEYDASDHSHSGAGAVWVSANFSSCGRILAYCIAGHHAGLPDWIGGINPGGSLCHRLDVDKVVLQEQEVAEWIHGHQEAWRKTHLLPPWKFEPEDASLWVRMLFSCLVDADFIDTEAFLTPADSQHRSQHPSLSDLSVSFFRNLNHKQRNSAPTDVNKIRAEIRNACESAAELPPGLFSLTVPTGGGKTLSSTAFAFLHALKHRLSRIIYVIPYTSIIEQTADILREFIGAENVVEHHSNFDPEKETQQSRLAAENWDAPVIVTTSVQFFESIYAYKSGRCRKLHNIAKSVVILDEAQLLPPRLLLPCVEAIRQLTSNYGVSMVLSTATQPALPGLNSVQEMIPPGLDLYKRLKRNEIVIPKDRTTRRSWKSIAEELRKYDQVLCIVNTRKDCRELHSLMPEGTIHLSATMCGEHRSRVIAKIKDALRARQPIRVISTQLVEAGVDIDFPVVYRAYTGLSSIAQSAGRCNREGQFEELGRVIIFMPPTPSPRGELLKAEDTLTGLLEGGLDVEAAESYPAFYAEFYNVQNDLGSAFEWWLAKDARKFYFQFREAGAAFRMIDNQASDAVIVRYGGNDELLNSLRAAGPKRNIMRRLQRYLVNIPKRTLLEMKDKGFLEEMHPGVHVQTTPSIYNAVLGLDIFREELAPEDLMI